MRLYDVPENIADDLLSSYADFLTMLDSSSDRDALDSLRAEDSRSAELFARVRLMSDRFKRALDNIFFVNNSIEPLTREYGVF